MCNTLNVDVSVSEIDRSHRTGKPGERKPLPIIVKQKLYTQRREPKACSGHKSIFINEDLTQYRAQLLYAARVSLRDNSHCLSSL
ncbi:hypothetical protein DPMN_015721 [Dreissena polymorpha]|uniref:Uncharacterized protein n=1 Tax=Dreissena polymorpha TaxID=45954 RepID=A0A9D4S6F2_DREPO|nr:hypothetical protein DPMN_015721 [Dreissena polymorpha]